MIFYGSKAANLKNGKLLNMQCSNCNQTTSMTYSVYGKYAHVYWIPFFPFEKTAFVECDSCKRTFEDKELTPENKKKLYSENERTGKTKYPLWMFSGLALVGALIAFGTYQSGVTDDEEKEFAKVPKMNDVYHIKLTNGFYSSAKVTDVNKDSVLLIFNNYETDASTGIDKIDLDKNYTDAIFSYSRKRVVELQKADTIYTIERK